jgi:hypothetical protein
MADESAEVTVTNKNSFELVQPFKVDSAAATTNTSSETLEIKPLSQTSNETLELKPVRMDGRQELGLDPVKVDSRQEVAYDPIRTDANSTLDLKPIAVDVCMRTGQASLPPAHVREPYRHRVALTLMGVEIFGLAFSGDSETIVEDRPGHPMVVWGDVIEAPPVFDAGLPVHRGERQPPHHRGHGRPREGGGSGLRIRLPD